MSSWAIEQMAFYGAYHNNKVNKMIHIVFVPILLWTGMTFVAGIDVEGINMAHVALAVYSVFYMMLDFRMGLLLTLLLVAMGITSVDYVRQGHSLYITVGIHILSWVVQFIGHGVYEKRAPALFTSFFQSLLLAPFFVSLEVAFLCGFKKETHEEVKTIVHQRLKEIRDAEAAKAK